MASERKPSGSRRRPCWAAAAAVASLVVTLLPASAVAHETSAAAALDFTHAPRDVLPWGQLAKVGIRRVAGRLHATFLPPVLALEGQRVTLYGYMTPIAQGGLHTRFLLSMQPLFCPECETPTGPEGIVEVNVTRPEPTHEEPLAVRGTLLLVKDGSPGVIYRMVEAAVLEGGRPHR